MNAIETLYGGRFYRSRLEARWAVFFDTLGIPFGYETEGFELMGGLRYLPDFWLPTLGFWCEVKGSLPTTEERNKASVLAMERREPVFIVYGDIPDPTRFTNESAQLHLLSTDGLAVEDNGYHWTECERCGFVDMCWGGLTKRMRHEEDCGLRCDDPEHGDATARLVQAYDAARCARFDRRPNPEHLTGILSRRGAAS